MCALLNNTGSADSGQRQQNLVSPLLKPIDGSIQSKDCQEIVKDVSEIARKCRVLSTKL